MDDEHINDFPYEFETVNSQKDEQLLEYFKAYDQDFVRIGPKRYFLAKGYLSGAASIYNFPLRTDDTFVVTFPKSGTTLIQELVWQICNNLDYEKAQLTKLSTRFPFLEVAPIVVTRSRSYTQNQAEIMKNIIAPLTIEQIEELPSPRFIKSHLPLSLLPPSLLDTTKVVYVARDPRDVAVSFYYHNKLARMLKPEQEFKPFWKYFVSDNMFWSPYFEHVFESWEKRNHQNMLFLFYEDIVKDLPGAILRVAKFFGKILSNEQLDKLVDHITIDNFKNNQSVNMEGLQKTGVFTSEGSFIRKGKSGGWRDYFDEEMTAEADEWIKKNLHDTDFRFPHC